MLTPYNRPMNLPPPRGAEKAFRRWFFYLIVLAILGVTVYWLTLQRGKDFEVKAIAKKGNVEYRENDKDGWKELSSVPFVISPSFEIRTFEDSEASLSTSDGGEVRIGNFSRLVLISNQGKINFVQTDGDCHYQVAKDTNRKEYKVSFGGDGDVYAEGTAFEVKIKENETDIFALESNLRIAYKDKSTAMLKTGEKILITPVGKITKEIEEVDLKEDFTLKNIKKDQENKLAIDKNILAKAGVEEFKADAPKAETPSNEESAPVAENQNANNNSSPEEDINFKSSEVNENANSSSEEKTETTTTSEAITQNDSSEQSETTPPPSQPQSTRNGKTTRSKCESSGGHFDSGNSTCTCSTSRIFSGDKCISPGSPSGTNSSSNSGLADKVVLRTSLSGKSSDLSWAVNGGKAPYGFKVINVSDGSSKKSTKKSSSWSGLKSGKTYKFQVCVLNSSGGCASYSNTRTVKIP